MGIAGYKTDKNLKHINMATIERSSKWRYSVSVKEMMDATDETDEQEVAKLCTHVVSELARIKNRIEKDHQIDADDREAILDEVTEIIDNFGFLKDLCDGTIPESEHDNYSFDGDIEQWFNDYLSQLYDFGDKRVLLKGNYTEKLCWID